MFKPLVGIVTGVGIASVAFLLLTSEPSTESRDAPQVGRSLPVTPNDESKDETRNSAAANSKGSQPIVSDTINSPSLETTRVPIPLPPELEAYLAQNARVAGFHQQIEDEPLDPNWGYEMETNLNNFYAQRKEIMQYGVPIVHCRSVTCEVGLVSYVDNDLNTEDWLNLLGKGVAGIHSEEPWSKELVGLGIVNDQVDGVTLVMYHLSAAVCREGEIDCSE